MTFYRRNLPHWHPEGKTIFITWRLYGSLPASVVRKAAQAGMPVPQRKHRTGPSKLRATKNDSATKAADADPTDSPESPFLRLDAALDRAKSGPLWLADPEFAAYAEYPILRGAELGRFLLHAYVIMPNHVHVLLDPYVPLAKISGPIKGVSACDINARLGRTGKPLWQDESFDHWIRNAAEFERIRYYIEWNPVHARLVSEPQNWKWSSAGNPYFKRLVLPMSPQTIH
jgi:putative transposase